MQNANSGGGCRDGCTYRCPFLVPHPMQVSAQVRAVLGLLLALLKLGSGNSHRKDAASAPPPLMLPKLKGRTGRTEDRRARRFAAILVLLTSPLPWDGSTSVLRNDPCWELCGIFPCSLAGAIPIEDNKREREQYKRCYK